MTYTKKTLSFRGIENSCWPILRHTRYAYFIKIGPANSEELGNLTDIKYGCQSKRS